MLQITPAAIREALYITPAVHTADNIYSLICLTADGTDLWAAATLFGLVV